MDITVKDHYDSRIQQFRNIYKATYELLKAYSKVKSGTIDITKKVLEDLKTL